jgi:hypothetical protein
MVGGVVTKRNELYWLREATYELANAFRFDGDPVVLGDGALSLEADGVEYVVEVRVFEVPRDGRIAK